MLDLTDATECHRVLAHSHMCYQENKDNWMSFRVAWALMARKNLWIGECLGYRASNTWSHHSCIRGKTLQESFEIGLWRTKCMYKDAKFRLCCLDVWKTDLNIEVSWCRMVIFRYKNYWTVIVGIRAKLYRAGWTWVHLKVDTRMQGLGGALCIGWFRGCLISRENVNAKGNAC